MKNLFRLSIVFVCLLVASMASAASFCPMTPPRIDGIFDCHEWDAAESIDLQVNMPEGGTAPARIYFMNDDKYLYVAIRVLRLNRWTSSHSILFDANDDRIVSAGDDALVLNWEPYAGSAAYDDVYYTGGRCPFGAICSADDSDFGGQNDVIGKVGGDLSYTTYEIAKPLAPSDVNDVTMPFGSVVAMRFDFRFFGANGNFADTTYPANWPQSWVEYRVRDCRPFM